jgi:hypothetical protein
MKEQVEFLDGVNAFVSRWAYVIYFW